ncbi:nucleotide-binding protein [Roseomonas elaeocarpi]|uniref:P-loop NTPase n=1 Tax=Roseomonas elaeocarpi TaxID=907779 RepID=A0ABV6JSM2_9PROT
MSAALHPDAVPPASRRGRLLGIASGKGGVGKTWFAVTLAQALARRGRRVLLADGDLGLANVDVQIGLNPTVTLDAGLMARRPLGELAQAHAAGFHVLPGRSGSGAMAGAAAAWGDLLIDLLGGARGEWDDLLLDIGAGLDPAARRMAAACDLLLVVATDEPTSLTDAYAVLKLHGRDAPGRDARIVVNMAADGVEGLRTHATLARACTNFLGRTVPLAGVVRRDPKVRDAIRHQVPLLTRHPTSTAAQDVEAVARGLG